MDNQIFPNWKINLRNALCVGGISFVTAMQTQGELSLKTLIAGIYGFAFAGILEFSNAYYKKNLKKNKKASSSFFLV